MLVLKYGTSVEAVQAINDPFPLPLKEGTVLVLPVNQTDVGDLPVFRPDQTTNPYTTLEAIGLADPAAFAEYNGFPADCQQFRGWVIVPHPRGIVCGHSLDQPARLW